MFYILHWEVIFPKIQVPEASTNALGTSLALIFTGRYSATAVRSDGRKERGKIMQVMLCDTCVTNYLEHAGVWLGFLARLKEVRKSDGGRHKVSVRQEMLNKGSGGLCGLCLCRE